MHVAFVKYEGTGNDFILVDNRDQNLFLESLNIAQLCHRQYGVGADGVILLGASKRADVSMRIFNCNGQEAEMCGNGLRCLVQFLKDSYDLRATDVTVETLKRDYRCEIVNEEVRVGMGVPKLIKEGDGEVLIHVGVPHLVVFTKDLQQFDTEAQRRFDALGININYAKVISHDEIHMRTFERGVEAETFSCGTGAAAVCLAAWKRFGLRSRVEIMFRSQERLYFDLVKEQGTLREVYMSGNVRRVFEGKVHV